MANTTMGGLRFKYNRVSGHSPPVEIMHVADDYGTAIFKGDLLKRVAGGGVEVAAAGDTNIVGVADGVDQYYDGTVVRKGAYLPASTSYDTVLERESRVRVILARDTVFEIDADDGSTATTEAAHKAFYDENCDITATAGSTATGLSGHCLDISTHGSAAAQLRIVRLADLPNQDFASSRVKYLVEVNESHLAQYSTSGV